MPRIAAEDVRPAERSRREQERMQEDYEEQRLAREAAEAPAAEGSAIDQALGRLNERSKQDATDRLTGGSPQVEEAEEAAPPEAAPPEEPAPEPVPAVEPEVAEALDDMSEDPVSEVGPEARSALEEALDDEPLSKEEELKSLGDAAREIKAQPRWAEQQAQEKALEEAGATDEISPSARAARESRFDAQVYRNQAARENPTVAIEGGHAFKDLRDPALVDMPGELTDGPEAAPEAAAPIAEREGITEHPIDETTSFFQVAGDPYAYVYDKAADTFTVQTTPPEQAHLQGKVITADSPYHKFIVDQYANPTTYRPVPDTTRAAALAMAPMSEEELDQVLQGEMESPVDAGYETVGAEEAAAQELGESLPGTEDSYAVSEDLFPEAAGAEPMSSYEGPEASTVAGTLGARGGLREAGRAIDARKGAALRRAGDVGAEQASRARAFGDADVFAGRKSGLAPSGAQTINQRLLDEAVEQAGLDFEDLTPRQQSHYKEFQSILDAPSTAFARGASPDDIYIVAKLRAMEATDGVARAAAEGLASEAFDQIDDRVAQSLLTRLQGSIPEGARGIAAWGKRVAGKAASTALEGVKQAAMHPVQTGKAVGKGALAALAPMPDPTDLAMLAVSAPYLGLYELGAHRDFENALQGRGPDWPYLYTSERLPSTAHRRQMFDFIDQQRTEEGRASAIKQLIEVTKFVEPEVLSAVIQVESDGAGLTPFDQLPPTERELRGGTAEAARETAPAFSPKL